MIEYDLYTVNDLLQLVSKLMTSLPSTYNAVAETAITIDVNSNNSHTLKHCEHQVAGHLPDDGVGGSLIDESGQFYKPLQAGPRGINELNFYSKIFSLEFLQIEDKEEYKRRLQLRQLIPKFFGTLSIKNQQFLILQDAVYGYSKSSIMDVKIGFRTWYPAADEEYKVKAKRKDSTTTQGTIGFRICGMQIYNKLEKQFHRWTKSTCKRMSETQVFEALKRFGDNQSGMSPQQVYNNPNGAIAQLKELKDWSLCQSMFNFYSSSILLIYNGEAECEDNLKVQVKLIDFAHAYPTNATKDSNFSDGLTSFINWLESVGDECKESMKQSQNLVYNH